ncbi:MAG TPA: hypothetical protein VNS58_02490 [Puia sp.]|nr:hypothetical protein [Puia sp.]
MGFIADKQTLDDLNLLGKYKPNAVYGIFNQVKTNGGERLLETMFHSPLTDPDKINTRSRLFQYFQDKELKFPFGNEAFHIVENYLGMRNSSNFLVAAAGILRKKLLVSLVHDEQYDIIRTGLLASIEMLNMLKDFVHQLEEDCNDPYHDQVLALRMIFTDRRMEWLTPERGVQQLPLLKIARYDHLLRHALRAEMATIMERIYDLDVCIAVSDVARAKGFSYAHALPGEHYIFSTTALSHPGLEKAVANPVTLQKDSNFLFLTGANMAGKSTFMKSFGIAVYLAHMGFPVAAKEMVFSVRDGLYSSINVPDNLSLGYSHFYAEVLRVKKVAEEVSQSRNLVVIFDELFKGTNVKDAYDATLSVTAAFSEYRNCFFIISTHIIEVGEILQKRCDNLQFAYLPTVMEDTVPRYTYQLAEGVTSDRHGMMIIENENILEIIRLGIGIKAYNGEGR